MDPWAWSVLDAWIADRIALPPGPPFCVIDGPTCGRAWSDSAVRAELRHLAREAGVRRRFAPTPAAAPHAVELLREGIPLPLIQRQLGHACLSTTGTYLQGISTAEIDELRGASPRRSAIGYPPAPSRRRRVARRAWRPLYFGRHPSSCRAFVVSMIAGWLAASSHSAAGGANGSLGMDVAARAAA